MSNFLYTGSDWSDTKLSESWKRIEEIAKEELQLDYFEPQFEIVDSSRMLDLYASIGMPIMYNHWSFGKHYIQQANSYQKGNTGLALELVINCLSPDTLIYTENGIKEINDININENIFNGKKFVKVKNKWSTKKKKYLKIILENNIELISSEDHKFPTIDDKVGLKNKKSKDLSSEDFFLYNKRSLDNNNIVDLSDFEYTPPFMNVGDKFAYSVYCKIPHYMTEDLAELMGIIVGDGCISHTVKNAVQIAVGWDAGGYEKHIVSLIKKVFDLEYVRVNERESQKYPDKNNFVINIMSQEVKEFLDFCGLHKNMTHKNKRVPWSIFQANKECRAAFLRGLFDTDGHYAKPSNNGKGATMSCYNNDLAKDVNILVNSLGIISRCRRTENSHNNISVVSIKNTDVNKFCSIVGSNNPPKKAICEKYLQDGKKSKYANDISIISLTPEYFLKKYDEQKYTSISKFLQYNSPKLDETDAKLFDEYNFIKIKSIELINESIDLIDIEVESEDHTFLANSILTHNCDPGICYLMDENTMTQQVMVMAHAACGHAAFFKNNVFFKQWTDPGSIIDYLDFAKKYINDCEEKYGYDEVEKILDACHALQDYGVDRYKKPKKLSIENELKRQQLREENNQKNINILWSTIPGDKKYSSTESNFYPKEPEENILYFIEKNAPKMPQWQREIVRIVRKIAQYYYPQRMTKISNEGFATFTHQYIMKRLHEKELIDDGSYMEFLACHSSVVYQPDYSSKHYSGLNPYALGSDILHDIQRICTTPTKEDEEWFSELIGKDWKDEVKYAAYNFRDESFIQQYLSPNLMRKWKLFKVHDIASSQYMEIEKIHNDEGFRNIRSSLAKQQSLSYREPEILINHVNLTGSRQLYLRHNKHNNVGLEQKNMKKVLRYLEYLWGYSVTIDSIESVQYDGNWNERIVASYDILS